MDAKSFKTIRCETETMIMQGRDNTLSLALGSLYLDCCQPNIQLHRTIALTLTTTLVEKLTPLFDKTS